jgi:hypothetical protein
VFVSLKPLQPNLVFVSKAIIGFHIWSIILSLTTNMIRIGRLGRDKH